MEFLIFLILLLACIIQVDPDKYPSYKGFEPQQIHIAFGEKINDVVVMWSTERDPGESIVLFGEKDTRKRSKGRKVTGIRWKFDEHSLPQYFHKATLKDLKYNTKYTYKVGSSTTMSKKFSFWTPRRKYNPVHALFFGDMGYPEGWKVVQGLLQEINSRRWDFVVHNGDMAYQLDSDNGRVGDKFMNMMQPLAANIQYMVSPGNHEQLDNFTQYKNRFWMPRHKATQNMYYSFNIGLVHFIAVNTEAYYPFSWRNGMEWNLTLHNQYNWLIEDLKKANKKKIRKKRPWIILYGHRPMYCSSSLRVDLCRHIVGKKVTENIFPHRIGIPEFGGLGLEDVIMEYGVDLVIWAHEHQYERTWPVYKSKVYNGTKGAYINPKAPTHFTTGAAGCNELKDSFYDDPYAWSAVRFSYYGYGRLHVINKTHLHMEEMSTEKGTPVKIDEIWLIRDEHKPYR